MSIAKRSILVLGASGLIGRFIADDLRACGFDVTGVARRFSPGQKDPGSHDKLPIMSRDAAYNLVARNRYRVFGKIRRVLHG